MILKLYTTHYMLCIVQFLQFLWHISKARKWALITSGHTLETHARKLCKKTKKLSKHST